MKKVILCLSLIGAFTLNAEPEDLKDRIVSFDEVVIPSEHIEFVKDWKELKPDLSELKIEFSRFMSNELGERFALVTFTKEKGLLRVVDARDVVGVLANGYRLHPIKVEGEAQIGKRGTLLLHFGIQQFPLVEVETRAE